LRLAAAHLGTSIRGKQTSSTASHRALSTAPPAALGLTPVVARCASCQPRWNWFACSLPDMHQCIIRLKACAIAAVRTVAGSSFPDAVSLP
jgi:hypothetical protein